jgi:hypothetical protein|tara:strand:- start:217 stop:366 length:150 start_codon:yes stop_codon:yes gene_type:complete
MKKFKVIKDKDSYAIYKCWLWKIQDENGMTISPIFASKEEAETFLKKAK